MKRSVRAGSLLVGVVGALAFPAGASAQLDPIGDVVQGVAQAVERSVPAPQVEVPAPAPARDVPAPPKPAAPARAQQSPAAAKKAPAKPSAAKPSAARPTTAARSAVRASAPARAGHKAARTRSAGKAHAASAGAAGAERALANVPDDHGTVTVADASSFTAGAQADTGTIGDTRLPFTGGYALPFLVLGAGVLLAGYALRTSPRLRAARRRGR